MLISLMVVPPSYTIRPSCAQCFLRRVLLRQNCKEQLGRMIFIDAQPVLRRVHAVDQLECFLEFCTVRVPAPNHLFPEKRGALSREVLRHALVLTADGQCENSRHGRIKNSFPQGELGRDFSEEFRFPCPCFS
jgi:hypothetical protein